MMVAIDSLTARRVATPALAALLAAAGLAFATPASATDGRTAVGLCIDSTASGARCGWAVGSDGSIDICNKNGCVTCASATAECTVADVVHKPGRGLPTGTKVSTALGEFTVRAVSTRAGIDVVIKDAKKTK